MSLICDTATVAAEDRPELWVETCSEMFVPLECTPNGGNGFDGRMRGGTLGPLRLCTVQASPHTVKRTARLAAQTEGDRYKLSLILGGEAIVVQDRREAVLEAGDFAIYDCERPYTLVGGEGFHMLVCVVPRQVVGLSSDRIGQITATRIPGNTGIAWAMTPFLCRLAQLTAADSFAGEEHRIAESVVDLVQSLCLSVLGQDAGPGASSRAELVLRIRAYIDAHLGEPDLAPEQIAAAHHVSKRYLHKLFGDTGVSVSRLIRERRLEMCRRDLVDSRLDAYSITGIGMRWGLMNPAHFSRLFHEAYGRPPSEFRREHLKR